VIAAFAVSIGAAAASANPIPGPPLASPTSESASDRAGAFCPARTSAGGSAAGFAAAVLLVAIAARRRDPE
jgi:hypothetical protein